MEAVLTSFAPTYGLHRSRSESSGTGDAIFVDLALKEIEQSKSKSIYLYGKTEATICQLASLYQESKSVEWDADETRPSNAAYVHAKIFAEALPFEWEEPFVDIDRDGEFRFEWILAPKIRISISIGEDAQVAYSWIINEERSYGVDFFSVDLPGGFEAQAERVFAAGKKLARNRAFAARTFSAFHC